MAHETPIAEKRGYDEWHYSQCTQDRSAYLADVTTRKAQIDAKQKHRVKHHLHVRHHTLRHGKDIAQKMIEERYMMHKVHTRSEND
jgi:hypothetical protein